METTPEQEREQEKDVVSRLAFELLLPTDHRTTCFSGPGGIRTPNQGIMSPLLHH